MARIIKADAGGQWPAGAAPLGGSGPAPGPEGPVDTATERAIRGLSGLAAEAQTVMLDARQQAARVLAEARGRAEASCEAAAARGYAEGLARGSSDGYADGFKKGLNEGRQMLAEKSAEMIVQLRAIIRELTGARDEMLHTGRCELLDFALELAAKIVGHVAVRDIAAARQNVRKVLELADRHRELCVKVNPLQLEALAEYLPELTESLGHGGRVRLAGDATISPGGAKVHTDGGEIDATIETQLDNVVEALLGSRVSQVRCGTYVADNADAARDGIADCAPARRERIADSPHANQQTEDSPT
jgi:flagellar assembly protein FliH